jgi:hypothetical protein
MVKVRNCHKLANPTGRRYHVSHLDATLRSLAHSIFSPIVLPRQHRHSQSSRQTRLVRRLGRAVLVRDRLSYANPAVCRNHQSSACRRRRSRSSQYHRGSRVRKPAGAAHRPLRALGTVVGAAANRPPFHRDQQRLDLKTSTHLGTEYAALLVDPSYHPYANLGSLPAEGGGVLAITVRRGEPHFWQTWWFLCASIAVAALLVFAYLRLWLLGVKRQVSVRYEERLAERARIARELHVRCCRVSRA